MTDSFFPDVRLSSDRDYEPIETRYLHPGERSAAGFTKALPPPKQNDEEAEMKSSSRAPLRQASGDAMEPEIEKTQDLKTNKKSIHDT